MPAVAALLDSRAALVTLRRTLASPPSVVACRSVAGLRRAYDAHLLDAIVVGRKRLDDLELVRRGERLSGGLDEVVLAQLTVGNVTRRDILRLRDDLPLGAALALTAASPQTLFPVIDREDHLLGTVSWADLRTAIRESPTGVARPVGPLADAATEVVTAGDSLDTALRRLGLRDAALLPVVEDEQSRRLVGGIGRADVMAAYDRAVESGVEV